MASITNRSFGRGNSITTTFADLVGRRAAWHDMKTTRNQLSKLSDRHLEDLGLVRSDIEQVARNRYTGR